MIERASSCGAELIRAVSVFSISKHSQQPTHAHARHGRCSAEMLCTRAWRSSRHGVKLNAAPVGRGVASQGALQMKEMFASVISSTVEAPHESSRSSCACRSWRTAAKTKPSDEMAMMIEHRHGRNIRRWAWGAIASSQGYMHRGRAAGCSSEIKAAGSVEGLRAADHAEAHDVGYSHRAAQGFYSTAEIGAVLTASGWLLGVADGAGLRASRAEVKGRVHVRRGPRGGLHGERASARSYSTREIGGSRGLQRSIRGMDCKAAKAAGYMREAKTAGYELPDCGRVGTWGADWRHPRWLPAERHVARR